MDFLFSYWRVVYFRDSRRWCCALQVFCDIVVLLTSCYVLLFTALEARQREEEGVKRREALIKQAKPPPQHRSQATKDSGAGVAAAGVSKVDMMRDISVCFAISFLVLCSASSSIMS